MSLVDGYNVGMEIKPVSGKKVPGINSRYNCGIPRCGTPSKPFKVSLCPKELRSQNGKHCLSVCQAVVQQNTQGKAFLSGFNKAQVCCECDCGPNCGCQDGKNGACKFGCSPDHPTYPPFNYPWIGVCDATQWPRTSKGGTYPGVFKKQCSDAYSWQFDDKASTYQCTRPDYVITFY